MVHRKKGRKLKRTASHRSALLSNLSISLIINKRIETTEAKAKELRRFIEPLVCKASKALKFKDSAPEKGIHLRREARKFLNNKEALIILFDEIGAKVGDRPGGYTRVLKTGRRWGDGGQKAIIEFVDYNVVKAKQDKINEKEDNPELIKAGKDEKSVNKKSEKITEKKSEKKAEKKTAKKDEKKKDEKKKDEKKKDEKKKDEKKKDEKKKDE
ncbi:MAG: 50S ribosomal protein L17, partial [Ignavibacteria bacterium]